MVGYRVIKGLESHPLFKSCLASSDDGQVFNVKHFPVTDFYRQRVAAEVSISNQVSHENLLKVLSSGEDIEGPYVTSEYCEYGSLSGRLKEKGRLDFSRVLQVAELLLKGLEALHSKGIVHGNISPKSIYIGNDGHLKLGDFGSACEVSNLDEIPIGILLYSSPEFLKGQELIPQSDFYSLGLTLYHLYYGRPAFVSADNKELARLHCEVSFPDELDSANSVATQFNLFLKNLTALKSEDRYESVYAVLKDLVALMHGKSNLQESTKKKSPKELSKAWLTLAAASVVAIIVLGTLIVQKNKQKIYLSEADEPQVQDVVEKNTVEDGMVSVKLQSVKSGGGSKFSETDASSKLVQEDEIHFISYVEEAFPVKLVSTSLNKASLEFSGKAFSLSRGRELHDVRLLSASSTECTISNNRQAYTLQKEHQYRISFKLKLKNSNLTLSFTDAIFLSEGFIFNKVEDGKVYLTDRKGNERIIHAHFKQQDLLEPLSLSAKNRQEDSLRVYLAKMNTEK
ncbi:MAG: serine/threonine protein kinase [Lentisphaerales bacterium]|nr:serine/threonine protein kinase [Lentisphaerales bacterium]